MRIFMIQRKIIKSILGDIMSEFELLCVTMHQKDFSKILEMNLHCDVVYANQTDHTSYDEIEYDGHKAKMINTMTRGVGINRNLSLMYATADICLLADDDMKYVSNVEDIVLSEFRKFPNADIIIFNVETDGEKRKQKKYDKSRKCRMIERRPWGAVRIAFRLSAIKKANLWFTTMFGGGTPYPSGEDSMWINEAKHKGLNMYISEKTIGTVSFGNSTWFTGPDEKFFWGKGAYYQAVHPRTLYLWVLYFAFRVRDNCQLTFLQKIKWMINGAKSYQQDIGVADIQNHIK